MDEVKSSCGPALPSPILEIKDRHLACAAKLRVLPCDILTPDTISMPFGNSFSPATKACTTPLKTMVAMAEAMRRDAEKLVEFRIGCRDHHRRRAQPTEQAKFERSETLGVQVLDRLNEDCAINSPQPSWHIKQGPVQEFDYAVSNASLVEPGTQARERAGADVHTDHPVNFKFSGDPDEQVAIAATQIENRLCAARKNHFTDCFQPLFMQPARHIVPPGLRMMATSLRGTSQVQPKRAAMERRVASR